MIAGCGRFRWNVAVRSASAVTVSTFWYQALRGLARSFVASPLAGVPVSIKDLFDVAHPGRFRRISRAGAHTARQQTACASVR
jgi:hypothetical protein